MRTRWSWGLRRFALLVLAELLPFARAADGTGSKTDASAPEEVTVHGERPEEFRGASDYRISVREVADVPRRNAADLLRLAPSVFLLRDGGGDGHADRIYLRGFDAREGQDIEFSLDGVPLNDVGNYHGNGYADLNFLIPELVDRLRVLEGPFDPHQGNFAVAGSAEFMTRPSTLGLSSKFVVGSFDTLRWLSVYTPSTPGTYGAVDLFRSNGFGRNRSVERARSMFAHTFALDTRTTFRVGGVAYGNHYKSAGLVRADDVDAGRLDFYGTHDPNQGGNSSRFHGYVSFDTVQAKVHFRAQTFFIARHMRLRENYTGFLLDTQLARQELHGQRGDLLDLAMGATTYGLRMSGRRSFELLGRSHEVEIGAFGRLDNVDNLQQRLAAQNLAPYKTEADLGARLGDLSAYLDASLRLLDWLTVRGGMRAGFFFYDVNDRCAVKDISRPDATERYEQSCLSAQRFGLYREPNQPSTTATSKVMPRMSLLFGPFSGLLLSLAYGQGIRTVDPSYVTQDVATPFAAVDAGEAGMTLARSWENLSMTASSVFFGTHVDRDQIFNQTEGRNTLATGTTRLGWSGTVRLSHRHFESAANASLVRARFDDTGLLVPYVPEVVLREDLAGKLGVGALAGVPLTLRTGIGATFVGSRPLPFGQRSESIFTVDASMTLGTPRLEAEFVVTNLFDVGYRAAEFNYSSDFDPGNAATLVPARMFAAGEPRAFFVGLRGVLGDES